eukprot:TRINITY_DN452_c2_g2_i1.p1 TRINITY_DN452_c2_g2~~TRINITY_DN452_c2_g2_i1.p1  ORF type:complete len:156 (-),score=51.32 TRINITY_DN452_c2_g2_i1:127-594(-)
MLMWNHDQFEDDECNGIRWNELPFEVIEHIIVDLAELHLPPQKGPKHTLKCELPDEIKSRYTVDKSKGTWRSDLDGFWEEFYVQNRLLCDGKLVYEWLIKRTEPGEYEFVGVIDVELDDGILRILEADGTGDHNAEEQFVELSAFLEQIGEEVAQ